MTLDPTKLAGVREAAKLVMDMLTDDTGAFDTYSEQELNAVEKSVERVLAALPGHWIAPDEATEEMRQAAVRALPFGSGADIRAVYRAMRDAAPSRATLTERDKSRDELSALSTQTQGGGE